MVTYIDFRIYWPNISRTILRMQCVRVLVAANTHAHILWKKCLRTWPWRLQPTLSLPVVKKTSIYLTVFKQRCYAYGGFMRQHAQSLPPWVAWHTTFVPKRIQLWVTCHIKWFKFDQFFSGYFIMKICFVINLMVFIWYHKCRYFFIYNWSNL
jgi:hypothetical protein